MTHFISKEDFGKSKHSTYKIVCPGLYKLSENISFNPKYNKVSAILIDSNDVVLDLNGKVLKQSSHNKKTQITGILVKTGHRNVTILGSYGTVKNFSQRGIYVEGGNNYITIGDDKQLTVTGCGYGTKHSLVDVVNGVEEGISQCGLQLGDQKFLSAIKIGQFNGVLNQLSLNNVVSSENNYGCMLGEGSDYVFNNCSFSRNLETRLAWEKIVALGGFYIQRSVVCYGLVYMSNPEVTPPPNVGINNFVLEKCKFNDNVADGTHVNSNGAYCDGFIMSANYRNLKVKDCQFNKNKTILGENGILNETVGFVIGAGLGTVVEDSEFSNNEGGSKTVGCGFSGLMAKLSGDSTGDRSTSPSESTTIRRCVASGNIGKTDRSNIPQVDIRGFSVKYPSGLTLIECVSEDNKAVLTDENKDSIPGFCDGIFIFSDPDDQDTFTNNVEIRGCKLSRNRVVNSGKAGGTSSGVRVFDDLCENILIRDCFISDNQPDKDEPAASEESLTTGIDLFNEGEITGPSYVTVLNNVISSNGQVGIDNNLTNTIVQGNNITNHNVSVLLSGGQCGMVIRNTFSLSQKAVEDTEEPSTNLVAANESYNTPCGYSVFYGAGQTFPTEVVSSDLPDFPALPTVSMANIQFNNQACLECEVSDSQKLNKKVVNKKVKKSFDAKKYTQAKRNLMAKRK